MEKNSNLPILNADEINRIDEFRKAKQTGVMVILFSDIKDSALAAEKLGEEAFSKLRHIHDEIFIRIMTRDNSGKIIKEMGDSFLCVFSEPSTAVLKAIEFQSAIFLNRAYLTNSDYTLLVKIGIHIGQVALENKLALDIFGRHVNRASRIQAIANGGQILASHSIWENAVGWLKNHKEKNINWISYGKTKLKGIKENVDIYCFYSTDMEKPTTPSVIRKARNKKNSLIIAFGFLILIFGAISFQKLAKLTQDALVGSQFQSKRSYYVQFDFSGLLNNTNESVHDFKINTTLLQEKLLSQMITMLSPESLITETDLIKMYSKQGVFYLKHENNSSKNIKYFRDTLNLNGSFFIEAKKIDSAINDSIKLYIRLDMYPDRESSSAAERDETFSLSNIETPFRNLIQDMLMSTSSSIWTVQGRVINSNDTLVYFKLENESNLRAGASIKFMREYKGQDGMKLRLNDLKFKIEHLKKIPEESLLVKQFVKEYSTIEKEASPFKSAGNWITSDGLEMKGIVLELFDSTGKATWEIKENFKFERPRKGDVVYLSF